MFEESRKVVPRKISGAIQYVNGLDYVLYYALMA